jgi:hypothetical protein
MCEGVLLSLQRAVNLCLSCLPLALFVCVHSARYVKAVGQWTVNGCGVGKGAKGPISTPICPILRAIGV